MISSRASKLLAVADGEAIPLTNVPDINYSSMSHCGGFAVEPISGTIYSPVTGRVENVAETKQAFAIRTYDGLDVRVNIGVETDKLAGKGFISLVEAGDEIRAGDVIAKADIAMIKASGYSAVTPVTIANHSELKSYDFRLGWVRGGRSAVMKYKK